MVNNHINSKSRYYYNNTFKFTNISKYITFIIKYNFKSLSISELDSFVSFESPFLKAKQNNNNHEPSKMMKLPKFGPIIHIFERLVDQRHIFDILG